MNHFKPAYYTTGEITVTAIKKVIFLFLLAVFFLMPLFLTGCSDKKVIVPPVVKGEAHNYHPGKFVWFDLFTTDIQQAMPFYSELFDWKFNPIQFSTHTIVTILFENDPIGAIVQRKDTTIGSKWLSYLSVEDINNTITTLSNNQGEVILHIGEMPNRGEVAIVADSQQATFAIIKSYNGDPDDIEFQANKWISTELWTKDVEQAVNFYQKMIQYQTHLVQLDDSTTYTLLIRDGYRRGGVVKIPWDDIKPEWIPYIAVEDIEITIEKVKELGGEILLEPELESLEGKVAIIADPTGAVLGIQQLR